jgi:hypothetical protein
MSLKPFNILCAAIFALLFTGSFWLMGFDVPDHRGIELWAYCFYTVAFAFIGLGLSQMKDL